MTLEELVREVEVARQGNQPDNVVPFVRIRPDNKASVAEGEAADEAQAANEEREVEEAARAGETKPEEAGAASNKKVRRETKTPAPRKPQSRLAQQL